MLSETKRRVLLTAAITAAAGAVSLADLGEAIGFLADALDAARDALAQIDLLQPGVALAALVAGLGVNATIFPSRGRRNMALASAAVEAVRAAAGRIAPDQPAESASAGPDAAVAETARRFGLTPAEADVLDLLARALPNAEIARRLGITCGTAKTHVHRVLRKLGATSRTQAALVARRMG